MGVFNIIRSEQTCPNCHAPVQWQSKSLEYDGLILANVMQVIELRPQMDGEMHAYCDACKTWTDATIQQGKVGELKTSTVTPPVLQ